MLDQLRLESYGFCCKMRVTTAVTLLGMAGITISIVAITVGFLAALDTYILVPFILIRPIDFLEWDRILSIWRIYGVSVIIIFLILLIMNIFLIKRIRTGSFSEVKSVLRVICGFFLSLHLIASIFTFITSIVGLSTRWRFGFPEVDIPVCIIGFVSMIFVCLAIHGVRKNIKRLINVYIIFNIVVVTIEIVLFIVWIWRSNLPAPDINDIFKYDVTMIILTIVYSFYRFGLFVVLYNIMDVSVDDSQKMNSGEREDPNMLGQLRLESYGFCCKMRVTTAVYLLGWAGIIISSLGLLTGIALAIVPTIFLPDFPVATIIICLICGVPIIVSLVLLILNILLVKRNSARTFTGVKRFLRILCIYCNVSFSLLLIENYIILPWIKMYSYWTEYQDYASTTMPVISEILASIKWALIFITFSSLGIHGVRMNKKGLLNVYIIFSIVMIVMYLTQAIEHSPYYYYPVFKKMNLSSNEDYLIKLIKFSLKVSCTTVSFFYNFGLFVVFYNMRTRPGN